MLKPTIFREYDIRGVADTELLSADVAELGQALGTYLRRHSGPNRALGRERRLSSTALARRAAAGLQSQRLRCHRYRRGRPRPLLYFAAVHIESRRRRDDHRQPQSARVQRLQNRVRLRYDSRRGHSGSSPHDRSRRSCTPAPARETTADVATPYVDEVAAQFQFPRRIRGGSGRRQWHRRARRCTAFWSG